MALADDDQCRYAVLRGGPVDGRVDHLDPTTVELSVVFTDGQRHKYDRTDEHIEVLNGHNAAVFEWRGREYGLR